MGSQYSPSKIESLPEEELPTARAVIIGELRGHESVLAGGGPPDQNYWRMWEEAQTARFMLAQIRDRLLLATTEKLSTSAESLQLSTADMVGGVKTLNEGVRTLNSSVKSLENTTAKIVRSSTRIEYLTVLVALTTISSIAITLLQINIYYSVVVSIAGAFALIRLWQKISMHPAFQPE